MDLKRYFGLVRHWLWFILLGAFLAGSVTYIITRNRTPLFSATASYLIDTAPGADGTDYTQILVDTRLTQNYAQLFKMANVLESVVQELQLPFDAYTLRNNITVSAPRDTKILRVTVIDDNPNRAAVIANTVGEVFDKQYGIQQDQRYLSEIEQWDVFLQDLSQQRRDVVRQISELGVPQSDAERTELDILNLRQNEIEDNYSNANVIRRDLELEKTRTRDNIVRVEDAVTPQDAFSPRTTTNTVLATLLGGLATLGMVLLVDFLDDTVKSPEEVMDDTGLSTLATIGFIKGDVQSDRLITYHTPRAPISEAYRVLRTNLNFASIDTGLKNLLVTSSSPGEGKSTTSANLAVAIAQTGKRVVLIDADLRRPSQHKIFASTNNQGLTTALLDSRTPVRNHLQETQVPGLRLMSSGPLPPNPAELLNSQRMEDVLDEIGQEVDLVLVDTPPVLTVADASILASRVNGCVLVAEVGQTKRGALQESTQRLLSTGASVYGFVLNRSNPGRSNYYQYYYENRYYSYEYAATPTQKQSSGRRLLGWLTGSPNNN